MSYPYQIWDVFTDTRLAGNPLAVVFDAGGITTGHAQAIAAEMNLSETIFLSPGTAGRHDARIFTPQHEMPFAGHPTVGGSIAAARRAGGLTTITLDLPAGPTVCAVEGTGETSGRATITAPKVPQLEDGVGDVATLSIAIGLPTSAIGAGTLMPTRATSGPRWTIIPIKNPADLDRISLDASVLATFADHSSTYVIAPDGSTNAFRCRMFAPVSGIQEDPATGSAAVAFAALWRAAYEPADGVHELSITQGVEMGRTSNITLTIVVDGGTITRVDLSGAAVLVAEGTLYV